MKVLGVIYNTYSFDGDTISCIVLCSEDAKEEVRNHLNSAAAYIAAGKGLINNPYTDPVKRVLFNMTGD